MGTTSLLSGFPRGAHGAGDAGRAAPRSLNGHELQPALLSQPCPALRLMPSAASADRINCCAAGTRGEKGGVDKSFCAASITPRIAERSWACHVSRAASSPASMAVMSSSLLQIKEIKIS